jgi:hypothetical protein
MFKDFLKGIYQKGEKIQYDIQKRPVVYESYKRYFWYIVITHRMSFTYPDSEQTK